MAHNPPMVSNLTVQTGNIGATTVVPASGVVSVWLVTYTISVNVAGTSGTVLITYSWNDGTNAQSLITATIAFGTIATPVSGTFTATLGTSQALTFTTTTAALTGSPKYNVAISAMRIS